MQSLFHTAGVAAERIRLKYCYTRHKQHILLTEYTVRSTRALDGAVIL